MYSDLTFKVHLMDGSLNNKERISNVMHRAHKKCNTATQLNNIKQLSYFGYARLNKTPGSTMINSNYSMFEKAHNKV